jgi:hypothetical protein
MLRLRNKLIQLKILVIGNESNDIFKDIARDTIVNLSSRVFIALCVLGLDAFSTFAGCFPMTMAVLAMVFPSAIRSIPQIINDRCHEFARYGTAILLIPKLTYLPYSFFDLSRAKAN